MLRQIPLNSVLKTSLMVLAMAGTITTANTTESGKTTPQPTVSANSPMLEQITAVPNMDVILARRPARKLSDYGLFADLTNHVVVDEIVPYDLITPLFTDYAHKYRFAYVPNGQAAQYTADEAFEFPVGSVLIKTFAYPADFRKPDQNIRRIETRLLLRQEKGWAAWSYKWNEDQTDADLKIAGDAFEVNWVDEMGDTQKVRYAIPNRNQCKGCHVIGKEFSPIGPKARNLNMDYSYSTGPQNQLTHWTNAGILDGLPDLNQVDRVADAFDPSQPLDKRARAYLDINCAHCHRLEGPASTTGLFLLWTETNPVRWGLNKNPVAAGRGSGGLKKDVIAGHPEQSILYYRMNSKDPGVMMPELGRAMIHKEGVALVEQWITSLKND